jgi:hypothetical protein
VFIFTVMGSLLTSRMYHAISSRSFSLKEGAAAAMKTPPSLSVFSYRVTECPRLARRIAAYIPLIPPPMTEIFLAFLEDWMTYFLDCMVSGFRAQRASPMVSVRSWVLA